MAALISVGSRDQCVINSEGTPEEESSHELLGELLVSHRVVFVSIRNRDTCDPRSQPSKLNVEGSIPFARFI
jgi:hypothetical protein